MTLKRDKKKLYCSEAYINSFVKLLCKQIVYYMGHEVANIECNVLVAGMFLSILRPQYLCVCEQREFFH